MRALDLFCGLLLRQVVIIATDPCRGGVLGLLHERVAIGKLTTKCPDCRGEMVKTRTGWECPDPDCDVIRVSTKRGYGWEETRVVRRSIVIEGGKIK